MDMGTVVGILMLVLLVAITIKLLKKNNSSFMTRL